jgi:capsular polysaccharide biosynthesis protein
VFLARLPGARLLGPHGTVITAAGDVVEESAWGGGWLERGRALRALRLPTPMRLDGEYYTIASLYAEGYAHWVLDVLPRLIALERVPPSQPQLVVAQPLAPWQAESLDLLRFGTVPRVTLGDRYLAMDLLHLPSYVGSPGHPHPWACEWLRERLVGSARPTAGYRRLYVTRRRALRRRVVNEDELLPILQDLGFEIVECETLSFREQIELFQDAEVVAGPHGAGLTNLVWAPSGCRVLELFGHRCVRSLFYALAGLRAQPYAFLVGASEGAIGVHRDEGFYDMRVPPKTFAHALRAVLGTAEMTSA